MNDLTRALRSRRTDKVLVDPNHPLPAGGDHRALVDSFVGDAGWAPFHYPAGKAHREDLDSPVPWRFYKVDTAGCRKLAEQFNRQASGSDAGASKIAAMLAGADVLVQVTWLPDPVDSSAPPDQNPFVGSQRNMEHIAAASAAVQSFLLLATQAGYRTYWSSGGVLRNPSTFTQLNIPSAEILLGSIFLFPQDTGNAEIKPGAWRDKRGDFNSWSAWCDV
ncbi:MAG: nitroreductase family protein [Burkholderiaceae bacterium]